MATNLTAGAPTRDSEGLINERNESGIYPPFLYFTVIFSVFLGNQIVHEGNFFFTRKFPSINTEGMIELENHLWQALKWNNGSRKQSSRNRNFTMKRWGWHMHSHSSILASFQVGQTNHMASWHWATRTTKYWPGNSCLKIELEYNWTSRSLYHPLYFCVRLKLFIKKIFKNTYSECSQDLCLDLCFKCFQDALLVPCPA